MTPPPALDVALKDTCGHSEQSEREQRQPEAVTEREREGMERVGSGKRAIAPGLVEKLGETLARASGVEQNEGRGEGEGDDEKAGADQHLTRFLAE